MLGTLNHNQIDHILHRCIVGRIGCHSGEEMYVVPVTYVYHDGYIYAHSKEGKKILMMRENPHICFQVDEIENMSNWRSVIAWGRFEELTGDEEHKAAMKIMMDKLAPFMTSETVRPSHGLPPQKVEKALRAVVFRIHITKSTGRFEKTTS